jgi:hypothetical protein
MIGPPSSGSHTSPLSETRRSFSISAARCTSSTSRSGTAQSSSGLRASSRPRTSSTRSDRPTWTATSTGISRTPHLQPYIQHGIYGYACRAKRNSNEWSTHAFGIAIDASSAEEYMGKCTSTVNKKPTVCTASDMERCSTVSSASSGWSLLSSTTIGRHLSLHGHGVVGRSARRGDRGDRQRDEERAPIGGLGAGRHQLR